VIYIFFIYLEKICCIMKSCLLLPLSHLILMVLPFLPVFSFCQEKFSFEKVTLNEMTMKCCPFDTTAGAMVLGDVGTTHFVYDDNIGFYMIYERMVRIKIFTKDGYQEADWVIPIYHTDQKEEGITDFKAKTYNLVGDKISETKLKDESVFKEEEDLYQLNYRFTFPAVKEGSVIELKYKIKTQFFHHFRGWQFQWDIPVQWSEYTVMIPEYFHYGRQTYGYLPFVINEVTGRPNSIRDLLGGKNAIHYDDNILHLAARNIPAIREESFVNSLDNYTLRVEFSLHSYQFPDQAFVKVNTSWEQITEDLMRDKDFGGTLKRSGIVKDMASTILEQTDDPFRRMLLARKMICDMMQWNEKYSIYPTTNLKKAMEKKSGNSADINLLMLMLMKELGLEANPVLLSTRGHGLVSEFGPTILHMNNVIALVRIGNKDYLLDATRHWLPFDMLPLQCLNGKGLVIEAENIRWVPLLNNERYNRIMFANFTVSDDGTLSGTLESWFSGYDAGMYRNQLAKEGKEKFSESLKKVFKNWEVDEITITNSDSISEPFKTGLKITGQDIAMASGDMIYLPAMAGLGMTQNPFVQENRFTPIDFGCPVKDSYVFTFTIPPGYKVESIPANARLELPEKAGSFRFFITAEGDIIKVNSQFSITRTQFLPGDYKNLRDLYTQMIARQVQQIVLKKS